MKRGYLLWGSDAEGGAPYAFPDPKDPARLIGFEVDLAEAIARELGVPVRQSQNAWDSLIPALERGDFDFAMNGIEITPQRRERLLFSVPYYVYTEQLVVRKDETRIDKPDDLRGKKVGTLSGAVAQEMLQKIGGIDVKVYPGQVEPYEDLALGRLDGDVAQKCAENGMALEMDGRDGQFDGELPPGSIQCRDFNAGIQDRALAGFGVAAKSLLVCIAVLVWNNRIGERLSDDLSRVSAENPFRLSIPAGDQALAVDGDHGVQGNIDNLPDSGFICLQRVMGAGCAGFIRRLALP